MSSQGDLMSIKLKPCPCCGHEALIRNLHGEGEKFGSCCTNCFLEIDTVYHSEEAAARAWNRRVPDPVKAELLEALEKLLAWANTSQYEKTCGKAEHDDVVKNRAHVAIARAKEES